MTRRWWLGVGVLLVVALGPGVSAAQTPLPTAWVQAGPALTVHPEGALVSAASPC